MEKILEKTYSILVYHLIASDCVSLQVWNPNPSFKNALEGFWRQVYSLVIKTIVQWQKKISGQDFN